MCRCPNLSMKVTWTPSLCLKSNVFWRNPCQFRIRASPMMIGSLPFWSPRNCKRFLCLLIRIAYSIYSTNYGGSLHVWSHSGDKICSSLFKEDSLRCVDKLNMEKGGLFKHLAYSSFLMFQMNLSYVVARPKHWQFVKWRLDVNQI